MGHLSSLITSSASQVLSALVAPASTRVSSCEFVVPESVHISAHSSLGAVSTFASSGTGGTAEGTADSSPS